MPFPRRPAPGHHSPTLIKLAAAIALLLLPLLPTRGHAMSETSVFTNVSTPFIGGISCIAGGQSGSDSLTFADCVPGLPVDDYQLAATANATFSGVGAEARVQVTDAIFNSSGPAFTAAGSADFTDTIILNANVAAGTRGTISLSLGLTGTAAADPGGSSRGVATLRAESAFDAFSLTAFKQSDGQSRFDGPSAPLEFEWGQPIEIELALSAEARFQASISGGTVGEEISGGASAFFGSTAVINGIVVRDEAGEILDATQYSIESDSGQFAIVPEPGTGLLVGLGLATLCASRRPSASWRAARS